MIFGDKKTFAIEIEVSKFFYDDFVGEGKFVVFLKDSVYGINEPYATTFSCIKDELLQFSNNLINSNKVFDLYSSLEIARGYYLQNYSDIDTSNIKSELLKETKHLISWSPESAFDDGSYLIHIDNDDLTRIIGFKSFMKAGHAMIKKKSINEIIINRNIFTSILLCAYNYLQGLSK